MNFSLNISGCITLGILAFYSKQPPVFISGLLTNNYEGGKNMILEYIP